MHGIQNTATGLCLLPSLLSAFTRRGAQCNPFSISHHQSLLCAYAVHGAKSNLLLSNKDPGLWSRDF